MSLPHAAAALLGQHSNWTRLGDRFSGQHLQVQAEDLWWAIGLVVFFGGLTVGLRVLSRFDAHGGELRSQPKQVFRDLCDAHGLSAEERRALRSLAGEHRLASLGEVFVRPELFRDDSVRELGERLFGVRAV